MTASPLPPAPPAPEAGWKLEHSYASLPAPLHRPWEPTPVEAPSLLVFNRTLACALGLNPEALDSPEGAAIFAGNLLPPGASPLVQAYAGHQFGHLSILGDGRALLLGEQITPGGARFDIQLKGSGPTPFSRGGDGRAALGPMLREYLISEAMHALGIPTTRSLAVVATGQPVFRNEPLAGAVLTRVAASHLRIGTFEWAAAKGERPLLEALTTYALQRHYPSAHPQETPALTLLRAVAEAHASLLARWMQVGFVHGVMNTDNAAISGETIDYGPCAFIDRYDPQATFSSIDRSGRYAFAHQPFIAQWNLARFAEALLPLLHSEEKHAIELANAQLQHFHTQFDTHWADTLRAKLGLPGAEPDDTALAQELLDWMAASRADYTRTFRALSSEEALLQPPFEDPAFRAWHARWLSRRNRPGHPFHIPEIAAQQMRRHNPALIPRNHLVEEALNAATENDQLAPLHQLLEVLASPWDPLPGIPPRYLEPAPTDAPPYRTFCGT
jgi:uncharacterized protein YdiU (UPF0061 family)